MHKIIIKKKSGPQDNYYATMKRDYNQQLYSNMTNSKDNEFKKTKNRINVIMYKNGFILNNGPFRDISYPENRKFMEEVEKGLIPEELMKKEINDLEIILENRKSEVYKKQSINPITATLKAYIYGNQNDINNLSQNQNTNSNLNNYNYIQNSIDNNTNIRTEIKIHPPIILKPGEEFPFDQLQNLYKIKPPNEYQEKQSQQQNNKFQNAGKDRRNTVDLTNMCLTPIWGGERKNIFEDKKENDKNKKDFGFKKKESKSAPKKKEEKKFRTFASLIKEEKEREEKGENNNNAEEKEEEKKFQAFKGQGQLIGNINTQGLHVQKDIKNVVDKNIPISTFSIRLFNGEIVKCEFNHTQQLENIYFIYKKI
jgi:hypothetical protein